MFSILSLFLFIASAYSAGLPRDFPFEHRAARDKYLIGVGKADITGPVVEIGFAGYANLDQKGTGLRQRLYSRAFIVADKNNPKDRFVYIVLDTQSGDTALRYGVLDGMKALGGDYAMYNQQNIALTGTHSHAGPGAWFNYLLPQFTTFGFDKQSYQAIVDGTILSIQRAHKSLQEVSQAIFQEWDATENLDENKSILTVLLFRDTSMLARLRSLMVPSTAQSGPIFTTPSQSAPGIRLRPIPP